MDIYEEMKLHELYYYVLVDNMYEEDIVPYNMEYIWMEINKRYFNEFKQEYNIYNATDRKILFVWLRDKARYNLLDELMLNMYNRFLNIENDIDNRDLFFINNISELKQIINDFGVELIKHEYVKDDIELSKITKGEVIYYVKQILLDIDKSGVWANIYDKLRDDDRIIYLNEISWDNKQDLLKLFGISTLKDMDNSCVYLKDNEKYILLTYKGDISDITTTVHELTHFISRIFSKEVEVPILKEFTAIFFELYTLKYLKNIGYSEDELNKIYDNRIKDSFSLLETILNMMNYLEILINNGMIEKEQVLEYNKNMLVNIKKKLSNSEIEYINKDNPEYLNYKLNSDRTCDMCIIDLINDPYTLFRYYPYIIGHYLSVLGINEFNNNKDVLDVIKDINENIGNVNPYQVFKILKCPYDKLIDVDKKKCKKRDK